MTIHNNYGFRPKSSTLSAIISLHEHVTRILDDPQTCGSMIATYDYSKAFDRLHTDIIINRLVQCNFPKKFVLWVLNYLTHRYQQVKIGTTTSEMTRVTSGVPQGSILGPYLYAISTATYKKINDYVHLVKYADDTTLCFPIFLNSDNVHILQEHKQLLSWSDSMSLDINESKCKNVVIRKRNFQLPFDILVSTRADSLKVLGVWFNDKATWTTHIEAISKLASRRLFAMRILKQSISRPNLKLVYFALVRSVLEYCAPAFSLLSKSDSSRLDRIQKRFHSILCSGDCSKPCLPALSDRRSALSMKLLTKIMSPDHILYSLLPRLSSSGRFILPQRATTRRCKTFFLSMCEMYNSEMFRR